jgi:hypothetical protein
MRIAETDITITDGTSIGTRRIVSVHDIADAITEHGRRLTEGKSSITLYLCRNGESLGEFRLSVYGINRNDYYIRCSNNVVYKFFELYEKKIGVYFER